MDLTQAGSRPLPPPSRRPIQRCASFVSVGAKEFSLTLSRPLVGKGSVRVELRNNGEDPHNLVVSPEGTHTPLASLLHGRPGDLRAQERHARPGPLPALVLARGPRGQGHERHAARAVASARVPVFLGFLGVLAFSFTLPATRVAVEELDPVFVGIGREALAAVLAGAILMAVRAPLPTRPQLKSLAIVASGVVFGWPLFSALALQGLTSAHSAVVIGILPAATAVAAVLRAGEHPTRGFWLASLAGSPACSCSRRPRAPA